MFNQAGTYNSTLWAFDQSLLGAQASCSKPHCDLPKLERIITDLKLTLVSSCVLCYMCMHYAYVQYLGDEGYFVLQQPPVL